MVATNISKTEHRVLTDQELWKIVQERDSSFDGVFYYAVRTTGIYCKPSCPSRRPNRENVVFFPVSEIAEQAGFKGCLRCHSGMDGADTPYIKIVSQACRLMHETLNDTLTLERLGDEIGVSAHHLQKMFKRVVGITPHQYAEVVRLDQFKSMLRDGWSVTNALHEAGYGSTSRVYERASSQFGMTPGEYRKGGDKLQIAYTIARCPSESSLGYVMVAATERGVCAVRLGDSERDLNESVRSEFPNAQVTNGNDELNEWVQQILRHLSGLQPSLDLPLDIRATAFERMVWEQLQRIPYGQTRSYGEIAESIGQPKATRAVANACAKNPTALAIPCHRVVRKDGGLGGYRWGIERKRNLLAAERSNADDVLE